MPESIMLGNNSQENNGPGSLLVGRRVLFACRVQTLYRRRASLRIGPALPVQDSAARARISLCDGGTPRRLSGRRPWAAGRFVRLTAAFNPAGVQHETVIGPIRSIVVYHRTPRPARSWA